MIKRGRSTQVAAEQALRELKLTCMGNLLSTTEECACTSRTCTAGSSWSAQAGSPAVTPGRTAEEVIGKTDFDFFSEEHAAAAFAGRAADHPHRRADRGEVGAGDLPRPTRTTGSRPRRCRFAMSSGRIIGTFGISRDVTAQIKAENALAYQVLHDPVTGLANRAALMDRLSQALAALERQPGRLAVLYRRPGPLQRRSTTRSVTTPATRCSPRSGAGSRSCLGNADTVARLGGDEFVVLCGALRDDDDVGLIGERIVRGIRVPYIEDGRDLSITCSVGIVVTRDPLAEPEQLVRDADEAMYEAKETGRNRYRVFDSAQRIPTGASLLQAELSRAIEDEELFLLYQPLFSLEDQVVDRRRGAGALAPSRARGRAARRFHPLRRAARAHRQDRLVRLGRGLPPARRVDVPRRLAERFHHGRQRVGRRAVGPRVRRACRRGDPPPRHRTRRGSAWR